MSLLELAQSSPDSFVEVLADALDELEELAVPVPAVPLPVLPR